MADERTTVGRSRAETAGDNLRVYLKEMASVPLLTRRAEVALARQMERGGRRIIGALAQCDVVEGEFHFILPAPSSGQPN